MTSRCESLQIPSLYPDAFNVSAPEALGERRLRPRQPAFMIWRGLPADGQAAPAQAERQLSAAQWGLVPHWVKSESDGRLRAPKLVEAHSETVTTSRNFRDAWLQGQRCIVPMMAFYADDWRSGKAVPTRIARTDGRPMGVAGLWARWVGPEGQALLSFTLLTVNANAHALMRRYQPPGNDKHMPVLLNEGAYDAWLDARTDKAKEFMRPYPAQSLLANPVEDKASKVLQHLR
ncbi:MAG: SOS response-associated peptidase [Comamonadaceae bacterium]|nr:MAG: SOS response-associated peptidase [Comamonadaceae bacterium]